MVLDDIPRCILYIRDDGDTVTSKRIENTGFSDIGSTDNGNVREHGGRKENESVRIQRKKEKATYFTV